MVDVDDRFVRCVVDSVRGALDGDCSYEVATENVRRMFLEQNSRTPDNVESIDHLEVGETEGFDENNLVGLKLKNKTLSLSYVFWKSVETSQVSEMIQKEFPAISSEEADALLRICTVILTNLEG